MIIGEVNRMEKRDETIHSEEPGYQPRPLWQVWAARVGLVLFVAFVIYQLLQIAGGGL